MDIALVIRHRLKELGLEQKELAAAARVTESYISQLLARKKLPPASVRTDIYGRISRFLKLPDGELSRLAEIQRREELKKRIADEPPPLFKEIRELILRKCESSQQREVRAIFEKQAFGELERLVTQTFLRVAQKIVRQELPNEGWLGLMAELNGQSPKQMRAAILNFLDLDVFKDSVENCAFFLDPLIESWSIDLKTFGVEIVISRTLFSGGRKRFEFVETEPGQPSATGPGFEEFLADQALSGDATAEEIEFLRALKFNGRQPSAIYYYRELQNLRDPLHFRSL